MKNARIFFTIVLCLVFASMLNGQLLRQTGMIRGVILDAGGEPLPGVAISTTSPALIGTITDVTKDD